MSLPTPNTRKEQYLNAIATGNAGGLPTPITREEEYLDAIAKSGGGSGEGDMKKSVYDSDLAVANAGGIGAFVSDAVSGKVDKVEGKGLSTNDYDDTEKGKVADNTAAIESISGDISDAYDSTHTYNVGDYCIYENTLYKCNTAIAIPEAFTPAKWTATNAGNEIASKQSKTLDTPLTIGRITKTTVEGALNGLTSLIKNFTRGGITQLAITTQTTLDAKDMFIVIFRNSECSMVIVQGDGKIVSFSGSLSVTATVSGNTITITSDNLYYAIGLVIGTVLFDID